MNDPELQNAARTAIVECMAVKLNETLLVVTDTALEAIGRLFYESGQALGIETILTVMEVRSSHAADAPPVVAEAMAAADAVIAPTSTSLTHTATRRQACEAGARVATMPGITRDTLIRGLNADYQAIADRTHVVTELLSAARLARVTSPKGTDIIIPIDGIHAHASTGLIREPGSFGNLPSGEAYLMPKENAAEGVIVVDGSMAGIGVLEAGETITMKVEAGYVTSIEGGPAADKLRALLEPFGKPAYNLAELGVGTNNSARICGAILEDEKVMGTVHLAVGNNVSMGGTVDVKIHLDGIITSPDLYLDGKPLLVGGDMKLD